MSERQAKSPLAIGVDVGGTKINAVLVDEDGRVVKSLRHPTDPERGPSVVLQEVTETVEELLHQADRPVLHLGLGIAGQIDKTSGTLLTSPNIQWRDLAVNGYPETRQSRSQLLRKSATATTGGRTQRFPDRL